MAGTLALTQSRFKAGTAYGIKHSVAWTSDASGDATTSIPNMNGWLVKLVTDPGATAPTDNYDITLIDSDSADALSGSGLNRDTANSEQVYTVISGAVTPILLSGTYTFTVANAGDSKEGTAVFYVLESV